MSIAAMAVAETPVAAQQQSRRSKPPTKRQIVAKSDDVPLPEPR